MASPRLPLDTVACRLLEAELLEGSSGAQDVTVTGVAQDSRVVEPGDLFLAWKGVEHDSHDFMDQAVEAGAVAVVVERLRPDLAVPQLQVKNGRLAGALAADTVFGSPWTRLFLAGVTGTNGKTTTAVLSRHLLQSMGPARTVGTLGLMDETGNVRPGTEGLTTPGPVQLSAWMADMADEGVAYGSLEASSHALAQHRLDGLRFDVAAFTTLGRDHLDYHADPQEYRAAKGRLLDLLKPQGWAVVKGDESTWQALPLPQDRTLFFVIGDEAGGTETGGDAGLSHLVASELKLLPGGSSFRLSHGAEEALVDLPLPGRFNVENALAAAGIARVAGLSVGEIGAGLAEAPQVPGRMEKVVDGPITVLIDFAHTPDALEGVLHTLKSLVAGRILVVFGAGGDRDRGKRPRMGEVVARLADLAVVTSDNPRTEDPEAIIDDVVAGMGDAPHLRVADRRQAIGRALAEAHPGDLVLLAGKGHETYQVLGTSQVSFDERVIVRELMGRGEGGARA